MFRPALLALALLPTALLAQRSPTTTRTLSLVGAPPSVTATWTQAGVQVAWAAGPGAAQYLVMRGADASTLAQVATVPSTTTGYLDPAVSGPVVYQVISVSSRGQQAASVTVPYTPPATLAEVSISKTMTGRATRAGTPTGAAPTITTVTDADTRAVGAVRNGQDVLVLGTGLDGLSGVTVLRVDPAGPNAWNPGIGATPIAVTPKQITSTSFTFTAQLPVPGILSQTYAYLVTVNKPSGSATSVTPFHVSGALPVRKILSVQQTAVLAGGRFKITGVGFENVIGGYIGSGVPGSVGNPMLSMWNRGPTYVELATPAGCDMSGLLMLEQPQEPTGKYITPDTPITVACVPEVPSGGLEGLPHPSQGGIMFALPGARVGIRGRYLKQVTRVLDQNNVSYPFTFASGPTGTVGFDMLTVTMPSAPTTGISLQLDHALTVPAVPAAVPGSINFIRPPRFTSMGPAWAEPGQTVVIFGQDLKWSTTPQVRVGGVPAQVISSVFNRVEFKVPLNASSGPVEIENEGGKLALTAPFAAGYPPIQHPGFFLVVGPSVVTEVVKPSPTPAVGDLITVNGQNLAKLLGICVPQSSGGYIFLRRPEYSSGKEWITSNTTMQVKMEWSPGQLASGPIQLYANTQPVGTNPSYACVANGPVVNW